MSYIITKKFDRLKAAHRQWRHPGHCARIHGECWSFDVVLEADILDERNFVLDFGELDLLKDWFDSKFDHVLLVDFDDPELETLRKLDERGLTRLVEVQSCSAEGLAVMVYAHVSEELRRRTNGRVWVKQVVCYEDSKNSATFSP